MDTLVLSRSLVHGLRSGQAMLGININLEGGMIVTYGDESDNYTETAVIPVRFMPELEELLAKLLEQPID